MLKGVCRDYLPLLELPRPTNGNPHYELGQVYDSIRVPLRAIPSVPFLNQQDIRDFIVPRDEYIPERQTRLTIEEIAAAYSPSDLPSEERLDDSRTTTID